MEIKHFGEGQRAVGIPNNSIGGLRWVVRNGDKVLQQQKFGIPADFKFPVGHSVVNYSWYWEDVPNGEE